MGANAKLKNKSQSNIIECPLGWTFNPSSYAHRRRAAVFPVIAFFISLYKALYQLGVISHVWDPFFQPGSNHVLKSEISKAFPIPDAFLAAIFYLTEAGLLLVGDEQRWANSPLLTLISVGLGLALACASIVLFILQPVAVGSWCTECLLVLLLALLLAQRIFSEGFAVVQVLIQGVKEGGRISQMLRFGVGRIEKSSISAEDVGSVWNEGVSVTWPLLASILLGVAILFLPTLFSISKVASISIYVCSVFIIACSFVAMNELLRFFRFTNCFAGTILIFWFLGEPYGASRWIAFGIGFALIVLNIHAGEIQNQFGIWSQPFEEIQIKK